MVARIEDKKPKNIKVGHSGTLDPAATGLLVVCVGKEFTKKMPELIKKDKSYSVEITLGRESSTGDKEGELTMVSEAKPGEEEVSEVLSRFIGEIEQVPPKYSAVKVDGKRAYKLAREGKDFELTPRKITIYSIDNVKYKYPLIKFDVRVSSGTYIRTLAEDIGKKLETGAYMSNLRRTSIAEFNVSKAYAISELKEVNLQKILASNS